MTDLSALPSALAMEVDQLSIHVRLHLGSHYSPCTSLTNYNEKKNIDKRKEGEEKPHADRCADGAANRSADRSCRDRQRTPESPHCSSYLK